MDRECAVYNNLGYANRCLGNYKKAIEFHQQSLSIAKEIGNKGSEGGAYTNLGIAYGSLGEYKKATELHQQALSIAKEIGDKVLEHKAYTNLGAACVSLGDYEKAIEFNQQALSIAKEIGDKGSEGKAYTNLGIACDSLGDYEKGIEFHQQSLSIAKEIGNKLSEGNVYISLSKAHHCFGDYKKVIKFNQQALSIAKEIGNKGLEGNAYENLGCAYNSLGYYKEAIEFHQQSLSIAKETASKETEGKVNINFGIAYGCLGNYKKAIEFNEQALSIAKEIGNKDTEGKAYANLGIAYGYLADYKKAIEFHQRSLSIAKEIGDKDTEGKANANIGSAYFFLGDDEKAIYFNKRAVRVTEEIGDKSSEGNAYTNLGSAYHSRRDYENAIESHQQALKIAEEIGNKGLEGTAYSNLAKAYRCGGYYEKATEFGQRAFSIAKEIGDKGLEGKLYTNLGNTHHCLGDYKKAIEFYEQSLSIAKEIEGKDIERIAYHNLGLSFYDLANFRKAEECFESSIKVFEEIRSLLHEKDEWKISLREKLETYSDLWIAQLRQGKTKEALLTAERGRAQALTDLMESQYGAKSTPSASKEQMERISNISSLISSPTIFLAEAFESVHFWLLQKDQEWKFVHKKIHLTLKDMTDKAYKQIGVTKPARCEDRSLDDPEDETIRGLSDRERNESTSSQDDENPLKTLYDVVYAPISDLIEDEELIIVPDGSSFLIPYAALVDQHSKYLSETLRIRLVPSLTSLKLLADCPEERHCTAGALLVGNPWTETVRFKGKRVLPLPGAEEEVNLIGDILNVEPLTGRKATKDQVLSRLNGVSLVHIASHGRVETGEIILSPNLANSTRPREEDFLLTMTDVLNAKLDAKLVVLSCCHSGQGKIKAEGVVGIARAFIGAGARSVIASLWAIDDEATLAFMRHFYEHLIKGQSASKSLHEAIKIMRESAKFKDVKYWAPFMLIGDDVTLNFGQ